MTHPDSRRHELAPGDSFEHTNPTDERAAFVLADLVREYDSRYGDMFSESASTEINRYGTDVFSRPGGTFLLLLRDGQPISAGAFMTTGPGVVEFKRMWTHADHRGHGYAALVLRELEAEAGRRGNSTVVLSTGPRQPEAVRLYLREGYTPLFDVNESAETIAIHHFRKSIA